MCEILALNARTQNCINIYESQVLFLNVYKNSNKAQNVLNIDSPYFILSAGWKKKKYCKNIGRL